MNMTSSPPATARGKLNCDPLRKIAHLGEDAKSPQKRNPQTYLRRPLSGGYF
jgi:hypothetical protein